MATNKNKIPKDAAVIIGQNLLDSNSNHFISVKRKDGWETWEEENDSLFSGLPPAIWCADAVRIDYIGNDKKLAEMYPNEIINTLFDDYCNDMPI